MVTKGYIVHVYDEEGNRLDTAESAVVLNAEKAVEADVWLPIFDDSAVLSTSSTIGRAQLATIPHTKIPLQIQCTDKRSAVLCAIQDFDLSTLLILGYLNNANNDELAPYADMHLENLKVNEQLDLLGSLQLELSKEACDVNNLKPKSDEHSEHYIKQADFEALYGSGKGVKNIQRGLTYAYTMTQSLASATGLYSLNLNTVAKQCIDNATVNLLIWSQSFDTHDVSYNVKYNNKKWNVYKGTIQQGSSITDLATIGINVTLKQDVETPYDNSTIELTFNSAIPVASGGTGANTADEARENLGVPTQFLLSTSEFNSLTTIKPNSVFFLY